MEHELPVRWQAWLEVTGNHTLEIQERIPLELLQAGSDGPDQDGLMVLAIGCALLTRLADKIGTLVKAGMCDEGLGVAVLEAANDHIEMYVDLAKIEALPETPDPAT